MPSEAEVVIGGVDTHKDVHVAAVVDERGKIFDTKSFPASHCQELWTRHLSQAATDPVFSSVSAVSCPD